MRRATIRLPGALVTALLLTVLPAASWQAQEAAGAANACSRVAPGKLPSWVLDGAWAGAGERLHLLDAKRHSFQRVSAKGRVLGEPPVGIAATFDRLQPRSVRDVEGDGLVVESRGVLLHMDDDMLPLSGPVDVRRTAGLGGYFPFQWNVVGNELNGVIFCGDVQAAAGAEWTTGLYYANLRSPGERPLVELARFEQHSPERLGCRISGQTLAVLDGVPYALVMAPQPEIYRVDLTLGKLHALPLAPRPEAMRTRPALRANVPRSQVADLMQEVEGTTMPVQLMAWQGQLYLLMREPNAGGTRWSLARIDPRSGRVGAVVELPTTANHLTVVPGDKQWALVERGRVHALGDQDVEGLLMVPARQVRTARGGALCAGG